jgi:aminopeptidase N
MNSSSSSALSATLLNMWLYAALMLGVSIVPLYASAPVGIPRELAIERAAAVSNIRYKLYFTVGFQPDAAPGTEELRFTLSKDGPLLLDFRGDNARDLVINGRATPVVIENGHIVLPAAALQRGENTLNLKFDAPVGPSGKAITRYEDKEDGSEYFYTLFVPMDASAAFPCFDQPDLKGRFTLAVSYKTGNEVISNAASTVEEGAGAISKRGFAETKPISTYLFAFAVGPFQAVHQTAGLPTVYVRRSQIARAQSEIPAVQQITADGIQFFSSYFAQPFPFPKYDLLLIPGFPFGGMEHAGATFLNEDSVLFRSAPTEDDRFARNTLLLHELAHQWFGDLTTMRWFDDLWLKEGFAQYMAYRALSDLKPDQNVWAHFYQQIKPAAYGIDVTAGTTPIYQDIANLKDAKSAYGAIVYSKAPALLKQLSYLIGDTHFRDGLRLYLREHLYANAQWSDLVSALERSSGENLKPWADAWITHRAMPEIRTHWECNSEGKLQSLTLTQKNVLNEAQSWPLATQILLGYEHAPAVRLRAKLVGDTLHVREAAGTVCPAFVFANDEDQAYGLFLLDAKSREYVRQHLGNVTDVFERTLLWGALWDSVRAAEMSPADFLETALAELPDETNETLVRSNGARSAIALHDYLNDHAQLQWAPRFETLAAGKMMNAPEKGLRILWFRTLLALATTDAALTPITQLVNGQTHIPEVDLRSLDRWRMVGTLLAQKAPNANTLYDAECTRDANDIGPKYAYVTAAAKPDAATKQHYFDDYLHNGARQEDWVQDSLGNFNSWNASALTAPYLQQALDALPQIKQQRKIFFIMAWLNAFIGGQHSAAASQVVHNWLARPDIDADLKLKVRQVVDDLDRTVKIRTTFP